MRFYSLVISLYLPLVFFFFAGSLHAATQEVSYSDFLTGNIKLKNGYYDSITIQISDNKELRQIIGRDLIFNGVTIKNGHITHAEGSNEFHAFGMDFALLKGGVTFKDGKVYLTAGVNLPRLFFDTSNASEMDDASEAFPITESVTIYFDGENFGFADIHLELPEIEMSGVGEITDTIFDIQTDPSFYMHMKGGFHFSAVGESEAAPGIDAELEIGHMVDGGRDFNGLKKFEIGASGLDINLDGMGITFLQGIHMGVGDVVIDLDQLDRLGSMYFSGSLAMTVLPAVDGLSVVEIDAGCKVRPWPIYISLFAETKLFGMFDMSDCRVTYWYPNHFFYKVDDYIIPGIFSITGGLSAGSWRDLFIKNCCYDYNSNTDPFNSSDGCVVDALNSWGDSNYGFKGNVEEAKHWDTLFHGEITVDLGIPESVPIFGGHSLFDIGGSVTQDYIFGHLDILFFSAYAIVRFGDGEIEYGSGSPSPNSISVSSADKQNPWEIPYNQVFMLEEGEDSFIDMNTLRHTESEETSAASFQTGRKAYISFMNNWKRIDAVYTDKRSRESTSSISGQSTASFQIADVIPAVIFRINYENESVESLASSLTMPDGSLLNLNEGYLPGGFAGREGYSRFRQGMREGFFALANPALGEYTVRIENAETLGNFTIEALVMEKVSTIEMTALEMVPGTSQYRVSWVDNDPDRAGTIFLYADMDRANGGGFLIGAYPEDDETDSHVFDVEKLRIPPGDYYIAVGISDGAYRIIWDYSEERIHIESPDLPGPVTGLEVIPGDGQFTISWIPSNDPNVEGYEVIWTANQDLGHFEGRLSTYGRDESQLTITDLNNGAPYLVSVVAIDKDLNRSFHKTILRVIPRSAVGITSLVEVSEPFEYARVGELYVHMPKVPQSLHYSDDGFQTSWQLIQGPEGMTVRENDGFIQWTPTSDQWGEHEVTISKSVSSGGSLASTIKDEFNIVVRYAHELQKGGNTANHILSSPELTAVIGKVYEHQIDVHDIKGGTLFTLMEGPAGMTCSDSGLLSWNVPQNAIAHPVRVQVTYGDGEQEEYAFFINLKTEETVSGDDSGMCFISTLR